VRVLVLDTGLLAIGLEGKRLWERRGLLPTGGVTITSDDVVLVADKDRVVSIDARGQLTEVFVAKDLVFVTPVVINASGVMFVASGELLHAVGFTGN
jgi:hypothetical protein